MQKPRVAVTALKKPAQKQIIITILFALVSVLALWYLPSTARAQTSLSYLYTFNSPGTLYEAPALARSTSPYFWLQNGDRLEIAGDIGATANGNTQFMLLSRSPVLNASGEAYFNRLSNNFPNGGEKYAYNGESIIARFIDINNYYYAGIRADGYAVIKKKTNGAFQTLALSRVFSGSFSTNNNPDLIPHNTWIGLKLSVINNASDVPELTLYTDVGRTGVWKKVLAASDEPATYGKALVRSGLMGLQSDHADAQFDNYRQTVLDQTLVSAPSSLTSAPAALATYDTTILAAEPVLYLAMSSPSSGSEVDKSGHGLTGVYKGGTPGNATLPNGDLAARFNGSSQYLSVPSNSSLSIPTSKKLTWEAWIKPDTLQFGRASSDGYVDWMGKCEQYSPNCEWEARMYSTETAQGRPSRLSAYAFNPSAGLGSGADWQPAAEVLEAGQWIHVVAEYDLTQTPSECSSSYPGSINIWVNGVKQSFADHAPTGCMSQYKIMPKAGNSVLNIGTMALDTWFKGAVGKVAVYDRLLSSSEISAHYTAMTGRVPTGSCGDTCKF